ncbi:beta-lactamase/transpeptidase-like protein [Xylaria arbuscula]|uniref:Beta-lactamase-related domain-containing protein n=1 Tax=Xylaria arbuscula TaxID=114810 RepID=A0A9W8N6I9_9PEZI|nr:beta-lactamase/transpeptidase-like protein [Xylaria arbuscula]KAJ3559415.1 hypothetical protein NPX13_g9534 [Xylaria arbuscula]
MASSSNMPPRGGTMHRAGPPVNWADDWTVAEEELEDVSLPARLERLKPRLQRILDLTKTPGCSIGVFHQGENVWKANFGLRDQALGLPVQSGTVFPLHELTKAITAAAFASLVTDGMVTWETPVKTILPELLDDRVTPLELLSMRSGCSPANSLGWQGPTMLLRKEDTVALWNALPRDNMRPFMYNSWGYGLVALLIEELTGQRLSQVFKDRIFDPLQLSNTKIKDSFYGPNNAVPYMDAYELPSAGVREGCFLEGACGIVSTIDDMLCLYRAYLAALSHQFASGSTTTPGNPFTYCQTIFRGHSPLYPPDPDFDDLLMEQAYGCGWVRSQLPGRLGAIGMNATHIRMPKLLENGVPRLCLYHQGARPGSVANIALFPHTQTVVAAVANSAHMGDAAD